MGNQLYTGQNNNIFPNNYIENIRDKETNTLLSDILSGYNSLFLAYTGDAESTRLNVPKLSRHKGLFISYMDYDNNYITEYYRGNGISDEEWQNSSNWRLGNNTFMGELSISSNGTWVINNKDTGIPARGETGTTPLIRFGSNNKFQVSYNNGDAWKDLTNEITNQLKISKYIGVNENLPTSDITEGTIYMKGPYYEEDDTLHEYPSYRMWIYAWKDNTLAWQDNGEFTSISAGIVQETGDSENVVMSQKAVSEKLGWVESEINSTKYSKNYPCVVELYINEVGKSADFANIHSLSLSQNTIKFTNTQGAWAGYSKIITTKDEIMAITPRGASDLSIIYGYVLIDWGKVDGDIDYITPIHSVAYNLDCSPSIKLYLEKGLIDEEFTAINSDIELIESDVDIIKKMTSGEEIFVESKSEDVDGVIDFRIPIGDLFPLYVKIDKQSGSNKNFTIRAFNSKNASERQMIVETANFGEYYVINPSFDTSIYDTLWLNSSKPSTIASSSSYSLYKSYTQENKKDVAPMSLDDFNTNTIIKVLDINGGGNYTDFSQACEDLIANERTQPLANVILVIKKGDYIINPNTSPRQSGPVLGCSIFAEKGARLICDYDGSSSSSVVAFSPINIYAEVSHKIIIDGLEIIADNCRYCIHDEMGSRIVDTYHHIFRNCKFTHKTEPNSIWASPRCVGGGLGNGGLIEIQNCEFESKINTSVDYHSGRDGGCTGSKVLIQNCIAPKNTFSGSTTQQPNANSKTIMVCSGNLTNEAPIQNNYQGRVEVLVINVG